LPKIFRKQFSKPKANHTKNRVKSKTIPFFHTGTIHNWNILIFFWSFLFSVFYVFYDQYLTICRDLFVNLSLSFAAVFLVTFILLGFDFHTSFLILLCVFMIIIDMFGVMYVWNIDLNAVSVVNIIMVKDLFLKK